MAQFVKTFRKDQTRELGAAQQRARQLGLRPETQADDESVASKASGGRILAVYGSTEAVASFRAWLEGDR